MPIDAPSWFVFLFNIVLIAFGLAALILGMSWRNAKSAEGKVIAEIWEPSGFPVRHLVRPDSTGKTVEIQKCVYRFPKEYSDKKEGKEGDEGSQEPDVQDGSRRVRYPSRRYVLYPAAPPLGIKSLQVTLRIESWERDNPEPIRPYYGELTVTAAEWYAAKSEIQAIAVGADVQESEAREKAMRSAITNQPNKMVVYGLCGLGAVASTLAVIFLVQLSGYITTP